MRASRILANRSTRAQVGSPTGGPQIGPFPASWPAAVLTSAACEWGPPSSTVRRRPAGQPSIAPVPVGAGAGVPFRSSCVHRPRGSAETSRPRSRSGLVQAACGLRLVPAACARRMLVVSAGRESERSSQLVAREHSVASCRKKAGASVQRGAPNGALQVKSRPNGKPVLGRHEFALRPRALVHIAISCPDARRSPSQQRVHANHAQLSTSFRRSRSRSPSEKRRLFDIQTDTHVVLYSAALYSIQISQTCGRELRGRQRTSERASERTRETTDLHFVPLIEPLKRARRAC